MEIRMWCVVALVKVNWLKRRPSFSRKRQPIHPYDWHNDPIPQYVITLAGVLEFTALGGETFTIHPGDVLVAEDHTGSGHKWRLTNDEPWKRAYVVFKRDADTQFVPDPLAQ
jgi:quercetin dioxygenase-like cupin family protein